MIETKRSLKVLADESQLHVVESFVEKICDDYNIFNSYFGIILYSVTETFRILISFYKGVDSQVEMPVTFIPSSKGLYFQFHAGESASGLLELLEKSKQPAYEEDELVRNMQIISMLWDHHHVERERGLFEIGFSIGSINNHLIIERSKTLDQYYEVMNQTKKV